MVGGDRFLPASAMARQALRLDPGDGMRDHRSGGRSATARTGLTIARLMAGGAGISRPACVIGRNRFLPARAVACQALPILWRAAHGSG